MPAIDPKRASDLCFFQFASRPGNCPLLAANEKALVRSGGDQDTPGLLSSEGPRNKTNSLHAITATI